MRDVEASIVNTSLRLKAGSLIFHFFNTAIILFIFFRLRLHSEFSLAYRIMRYCRHVFSSYYNHEKDGEEREERERFREPAGESSRVRRPRKVNEARGDPFRATLTGKVSTWSVIGV